MNYAKKNLLQRHQITFQFNKTGENYVTNIHADTEK